MAEQETIEAVANVVESVEDTIETLERIPKVALNGTTKKQQVLILATTAVVSAAVGGAVAWYTANKVLQTKYDILLEQELEKTAQFYKRVNKTEEGLDDPTKLVEKLGYKPEDDEDPRRYRRPVENVVDELPVAPVLTESTTVNIFSTNGFNYEDEVKLRTPDTPYIITDEEYFQNDPEHEQMSLTYYEGDDVLADSADQVIDESDVAVGDNNLARFGHGSKDKNIVYVRNERLETDFEIARSIGDYAQEVHGLRHSDDDGRLRKFRSERE